MPQNKYSGKKLSDVPYEEISIGMEVISARNVLGQVILKIDKESIDLHGDDNWVQVKWSNNNESVRPHFDFNKVTVK
jgi:hypothetical protein